MSGSSTLVTPEGYVVLRDAFNEVGRDLFGDDWTGLELAAERDENDEAAIARRSEAESAFRARARAGHIETFLWHTETGELVPWPRKCWLADLIEISWLSSTMELVNRSIEEASRKTEPLVLDPISRSEQFEAWLGSQRSPIEGMLWHYRYRVLVQQAPTALDARSRSEVSSREPGEPKPETIEGWKKDYETVERLMKNRNCGPSEAARIATVPGERSADAIARGSRRYRELLERQNGKLPPK